MLEGLPPNNATHVMRLTCDEGSARRICDVIVETFDAAETAAAAFEDAEAPGRGGKSAWSVEVYFGRVPDAAAIRSLVATVVGAPLAEQLRFETIAQQDWVAASLAGLAPVRAGRFLVHGSHDSARVSPNDIALEIEAALAFGTGHHGTTRGCLLMLERLLKRRRPRAVLDVGTGTGVLALAAAKALHSRVAAGDIDAIAVAAARANARLNGAGPWLSPVEAHGVRHAALRGRSYDVIFANILASPLRQLAPSLVPLLAAGGDLVLSGLIPRDVAGILTAYRAQGLALVLRRDIEGWSTLWLRRGGAATRRIADRAAAD